MKKVDIENREKSKSGFTPAIYCRLFASLAALSYSVAAGATLPAPVADMVDSWPSCRFMTYNISYCRHGDEEHRTQGYQTTAERINAEKPDFVALNEVSYGIKPDFDGKQNQATLLANATGLHASEGRATNTRGVAILSREVPLSVRTVLLPTTSPANPEEVIGYEPRVLLICEFTGFCVATSHFDLYEAHRKAYLPAVLSALGQCTKPVFFMGDWNVKPNADEIASIMESFTILSPTNGVKTYQAYTDYEIGDHVIDYIALTTAASAGFYVKDTHVTKDVVTSDHNPVVVDVAMIPSAAELGWVNENAVTTGRTGAWSADVVYDLTTGKANVYNATFTPTTESEGRTVKVEATMELYCASDAEFESDPAGDAQCAVRIGVNGCFQLWTQDGWVDVAAAGVVPTNNTEYALRFVFDYAQGTYSAYVRDGGDEWWQFESSGGVSAFPLAAQSRALSSVTFSGDTTFASLVGNFWNRAVKGFRVIMR